MNRKKASKLLCAILMSVTMVSSLYAPIAYAEKLEAIETLDEAESDRNEVTETDSKSEESAESDTRNDNKKDTAVAGKNNEENYDVEVPARSIRLKTSQKNKIVIGDSFQIKYKFSPLKSDDYVTYRNFHKNVVKVDETGLVTAIGYGTAKIQLEASSGVKRNIYFTVTDENGNVQTELVKGDATALDFVDKHIMVRKGKTNQIEPIFYPLGIYDNVTYKSANTSIAEVSASGLITAKKPGETIITVTTDDGISADVSVTVFDDFLRGIDVSKWQGSIDWKKVSNDGIDFVMIRSSFGYEDTDPKLKNNVSGCEKYGIDYGFYHYIYATNTAEARKEAKYFLKAIKNYNPTYPLVLDIEENFYKKMSKKKVTDIVVTFMKELEAAGYYAMIYSSPSFIKECLDTSRIAKYDIWIACWGDTEKLDLHYDGHYGMWQYSDEGSVDGIKGDVDLDYAFKDYAYIIKKNGLNR